MDKLADSDSADVGSIPTGRAKLIVREEVE